jgi:hypothetical protein
VPALLFEAGTRDMELRALLSQLVRAKSACKTPATLGWNICVSSS